MISQATGNLLTANATALVNTVNTVGVMGKGIALQFRRAYPSMYADYVRRAKAGEIKIGHMHVWETHALEGPNYVINFPTKTHWRAKSRLEDIDAGLAALVKVVQELRIPSIAIPPLGCGNGGLEWRDVEPRIREAFDQLPAVHVMLYSPGRVPRAETMPSETARPRMTPGRAALVYMLDRYSKNALQASLIETQKLMYLLQEAGEPLGLEFMKGRYGPYADNLRHVLQLVEGHFLSGFGDGSLPVHESEPIRVLPPADTEAENFLKMHDVTIDRITKVMDLIDGFESAYGLELLASVHWVASHEDPQAVSDPEAAVTAMCRWTPRKRHMFTPPHVRVAWEALCERGWLATA